ADIHQYTEHGRLPGYDGNLDLNRIISNKELEYFTDGKKSKKKPSAPSKPAKTKPKKTTSNKITGSTYKVKSGDTLGAIAQRSGVPMKTLQKINGISNPDLIKAGDTIRLKGSAGRTYTVKSGDILSIIAQSYGVSTRALQNANGIKNPDRIYPGRKLTIPGGGSSAQYHTVKSGDNVSTLAQRYGSTQRQIVNWNNLPSADRIYIGQRLRVK